MKKKWIYLLSTIMFLAPVGNVFADGCKNELKMSQLPQKVQHFVMSHFAGETFEKSCKDDHGEYEVMMSNGFVIEFNRDGQWQEVENTTHMALPLSVVQLLPSVAVEYLEQKYPNGMVCAIERTKNGYEVVLYDTRKVELHFDHNGKFIAKKDKD